jgi:ABC-type antimicrobial peptide transport system permease subunit
VLGVSEAFVESFDPENVDKFRWSSTIATDQQQRANPWRMLYQTTDDGAIPVIIDKNTANYSLKIFASGGDYEVQYDSGHRVKFRVVGFLENSVLQGLLIISEANFKKAFPRVSGYRYFLIKGNQQDAEILEDRLGDQGFDARSAAQLLAEFQKVQNTYINTFQTLGALGLLLGTLGLAAVQIRSVLERRKELGLMRSVGFSRGQLSRMVLMENAWLLLLGLGVGIGSALFATLPHYWIGGASVPWIDLALLFAIILATGLLAGLFASRILARMPLVQSLRV